MVEFVTWTGTSSLAFAAATISVPELVRLVPLTNAKAIFEAAMDPVSPVSTMDSLVSNYQNASVAVEAQASSVHQRV